MIKLKKDMEDVLKEEIDYFAELLPLEKRPGYYSAIEFVAGFCKGALPQNSLQEYLLKQKAMYEAMLNTPE